MNIDSVVKQIFGKLKILGGTDGTPIGNVGDALKVSATVTSTPPEGLADAGNSSATPLGANATFTGTAIDIKDYAAINVAAFSDVSSATDGLRMEFSPDGTNWDHVHAFPVTGNVGVSFAQAAELRYFRIVYINGATPQSFFRLTTILKPTTVSPSRYTVGQQLFAGQMADVTKSIIWGLSSSGGGTYHAVKVTPSGSATVALGDITGVVGQATMANSLPVTIASDQIVDVEIQNPSAQANTIISFNEISGVAIGAEQTILTYTVPVAQTLALSSIHSESDSVSVIKIKADGSTICKQRIGFCGPYNLSANFEKGDGIGVKFPAGTVITVTGVNASTLGTAEFSARMIGWLE